MPTPETKTPTQVRPGQVWADKNWRAEGRTLRVESTHACRWVDEGLDGRNPHEYARCTILSDRIANPSRFICAPRKSMVGKEAWVRLSRFRPTSTGYRLVEDAPDA